MPNRDVALKLALAVIVATVAACSDELKLPGCVSALIASCAPRGVCVAAETAETTDICFDSGIRATSSKVDDPKACGIVKVVTVANADGSPCYSVESWIDSGMVCEGARYVWKDASGQVVATGTRDWDSRATITCAATKEATSCKGPSGLSGGDPCCAITSFGTPVCDYPDQDACRAGACVPAS